MPAKRPASVVGLARTLGRKGKHRVLGRAVRLASRLFAVCAVIAAALLAAAAAYLRYRASSFPSMASLPSEPGSSAHTLVVVALPGVTALHLLLLALGFWLLCFFLAWSWLRLRGR